MWSTIKDFIAEHKTWFGGGGILTVIIGYLLKRKRNRAVDNQIGAETENTSVEAEQRKLKLRIDRTKFDEEREQKIIELRAELAEAQQEVRQLKLNLERMAAKLTLLETVTYK